jgi:lysophospholipase L1-like esterase
MPLTGSSEGATSKTQSGPRGRTPWFTNVLLIVLTLSLGLSLLVNLRYYRLLQEEAERARSSRMDLASEEEFAAANAALPAPDPERVRVVLAGDSDVSLWDPLPEVPGCDVLQRGFPGDRTGDLLLRLERDVMALRPAVAVITIGGNDLEELGLFPGQEEAIIAICERNIQTMVERLRQQHIQVVLLPIFPYGEANSNPAPGWSDATYGAVERVNARLRTLNGPGVTVLDCDPVLARAGRRLPAYSADMIHLNTAGYQAVNGVLAPVLASLGQLVRADRRGKPGSPSKARVGPPPGRERQRTGPPSG